MEYDYQEVQREAARDHRFDELHRLRAADRRDIEKLESWYQDLDRRLSRHESAVGIMRWLGPIIVAAIGLVLAHAAGKVG